jgi:hypothetical protein
MAGTDLESVSPGLALEIEAALVEAGQQLTLRRIGSPNVDVALSGRLQTFDPKEIGGGIVQGDRKLIIGNFSILEAGWPGPPQRGDQILFAGGTKTATVMGVDTITVGTEIVRHNLQVRGS